MNQSINWSPGVTLDMIEKQVIKKAFSFFRNNKTATAISLGISIRTLDNKLEIYKKEDEILEEETTALRKREQDFLRRARGIPDELPSQQPVHTEIKKQSKKDHQIEAK